jgi:hypothetical protein
MIGIVCLAAPFVLGFSDETAGASSRPGRSEPLSGS